MKKIEKQKITVMLYDNFAGTEKGVQKWGGRILTI